MVPASLFPEALGQSGPPCLRTLGLCWWWRRQNQVMECPALLVVMQSVSVTSADGTWVKKHHPLWNSPAQLRSHSRPKANLPVFHHLGCFWVFFFPFVLLIIPHSRVHLNSLFLWQKCIFLWFRALVKSRINHGTLHLKGFTKSTHRFGATSIPEMILHH